MLRELLEEITEMHAQGQYLESFPLVRECIVTHNYHGRHHVYDVLARLSPSMMA
jgi:hypothetical protein